LYVCVWVCVLVWSWCTHIPCNCLFFLLGMTIVDCTCPMHLEGCLADVLAGHASLSRCHPLFLSFFLSLLLCVCVNLEISSSLALSLFARKHMSWLESWWTTPCSPVKLCLQLAVCNVCMLYMSACMYVCYVCMYVCYLCLYISVSVYIVPIFVTSPDCKSLS
jgi:hypothetical protein